MKTIKYKEYKKVTKHKHIEPSGLSCTYQIDQFLFDNPDIKITHIIRHEPYRISIFYEELIPIN